MRKPNVMLEDEQLSSQNPLTSCTSLSGLLRWHSGKESACQGRRCKRGQFDPWVKKVPGGGNGTPLQYSCLVPGGLPSIGVAKSPTQLSACSYTHRYLNARFQNANGETQIQITAGTQCPGRFPAHLAAASGASTDSAPPRKDMHGLGCPGSPKKGKTPSRRTANDLFTEQWLQASYHAEQCVSSSHGSSDFCPSLSTSFHV